MWRWSSIGPKRTAQILRRRVDYLTERINEAEVPDDVQWDKRERRALLDAIDAIEGSAIPRQGDGFAVRRDSSLVGRMVLVRDGQRVAEVTAQVMGDQLRVTITGAVSVESEQVASAR
jgi:hypothetical protein